MFYRHITSPSAEFNLWLPLISTILKCQAPNVDSDAAGKPFPILETCVLNVLKDIWPNLGFASGMIAKILRDQAISLAKIAGIALISNKLWK